MIKKQAPITIKAPSSHLGASRPSISLNPKNKSDDVEIGKQPKAASAGGRMEAGYSHKSNSYNHKAINYSEEDGSERQETPYYST